MTTNQLNLCVASADQCGNGFICNSSSTCSLPAPLLAACGLPGQYAVTGMWNSLRLLQCICDSMQQIRLMTFFPLQMTMQATVKAASRVSLMTYATIPTLMAITAVCQVSPVFLSPLFPFCMLCSMALNSSLVVWLLHWHPAQALPAEDSLQYGCCIATAELLCLSHRDSVSAFHLP